LPHIHTRKRRAARMLENRPQTRWKVRCQTRPALRLPRSHTHPSRPPRRPTPGALVTLQEHHTDGLPTREDDFSSGGKRNRNTYPTSNPSSPNLSGPTACLPQGTLRCAWLASGESKWRIPGRTLDRFVGSASPDPRPARALGLRILMGRSRVYDDYENRFRSALSRTDNPQAGTFLIGSSRPRGFRPRASRVRHPSILSRSSRSSRAGR
jgi:hypothetical protein